MDTRGGIEMSIMRIVLTLVIMLSVMGGANFYVARRIYGWLSLLLPQINAKIYIGAYILLVLITILGFARSFLPVPVTIKNILGWISSYSIGIFAFLIMLFFVTDLVLFLGGIVKVIPQPMPSSIRFCAGLLVLVLTAGIVGYGAYNATQVRHVSYDIEIGFTEEMKVVMIADLHLGTTNNESNLAKIVQGVNSVEPDIVCIVGDIFNDDYFAIRNPDAAAALLKSINATYGVYAVLGNHDAGRTLNEMMAFLERSNINLLNDEYVIIDERLILLGRLDPSPIGGFGDMQRNDTADILAAIDTSLPVVVMEHNPSVIDQYGRETDLILSGHTHSGQIFPGSLITRAMFTVSYGHYQEDSDSPHVIVTSGVGTWGTPLRVGTNNEIVSIGLR